MEAKDTVINHLDLVGNGKESIDALLYAQAEVSFQAGQESLIDAHLRAVEAARLDGIREVVEWVRNHWSDRLGYSASIITKDNWQDKLKEWGVEK